MSRERIALLFKPTIRNRLLVSVVPLLVLPLLVLALFAYFIAYAQLQQQINDVLDDYRQEMVELSVALEENGLRRYLTERSSPSDRLTHQRRLEATLDSYLARHKGRFPDSLAVKIFDRNGIKSIQYPQGAEADFQVDGHLLRKTRAVPVNRIDYVYQGNFCVCGLPIYPEEPENSEGRTESLGVMMARFPVPKLPPLFSLNNPATLAVMVSAVVAVMVTVLLVLRINALMKPIIRLAGAAQLAAKGDVAVSFGTGSADEIGQLAQAFSTMSAELSRYISELAELNRDLEAKVQVRTLELQQANRLKSEFLANVTHELRTPLNSILNLSDILLAELPGRLTDDQKKQLNIIHRNGKRLLQLIDGIIELSQLETGGVKLHLKPTSIGPLVTSIASAFEPLARNKGVEFSLELPPDLPRASCDQNRLKEIFAHLLNNAVRFTDKGRVTVSCKVGPSKHGRQLLECAVSDTGIGIPPEAQEAVFDQFRQLDGSATRQFSGAGMGLALAKNLVEAMGGEIWLESAPGKGSIFTFTIPVFEEEKQLEEN